ncbi:MAG: LysR family transcriptional regulator [Nitrospinae bacterium]|nr:LysR family transcriptional regulator [Nitrospinota bacterium]
MLNQITIHQLDLFLVAAKLKNFSRAADQMAISQPAFSAQIIKLEKILGSPMFERIGRRIELTDAGMAFEVYAQRTIGALREGKQAIDDMTKKVVGTLRLGASTTVANYILPEFLGKYKKAHPQGKVEMMVGNTNQIEQSLLRGEVDLGIVEGPVKNNNIETYLFKNDELVVIFSSTHSWKNRRTVSMDELKKEPLIIRERGSGTRKVFMDQVDFDHNPLNVVMELGDTEAIKKSAQANLGVAVVSRAAITSELKDKSLRCASLDGVSLRRKLTLIILKNRYLSNPLKAFTAILDPIEKVAENKPAHRDNS